VNGPRAVSQLAGVTGEAVGPQHRPTRRGAGHEPQRKLPGARRRCCQAVVAADRQTTSRIAGRQRRAVGVAPGVRQRVERGDVEHRCLLNEVLVHQLQQAMIERDQGGDVRRAVRSGGDRRSVGQLRACHRDRQGGRPALAYRLRIGHGNSSNGEAGCQQKKYLDRMCQSLERVNSESDCFGGLLFVHRPVRLAAEFSHDLPQR